jgi:hypothetical protein
MRRVSVCGAQMFRCSDAQMLSRCSDRRDTFSTETISVTSAFRDGLRDARENRDGWQG